jgi:hypothetical protein
VGGRGWGGKGGEMAQTMYAHMNKKNHTDIGIRVSALSVISCVIYGL